MIRTLFTAAILGAILAYGLSGALEHAETVGAQYQVTAERHNMEHIQ